MKDSPWVKVQLVLLLTLSPFLLSGQTNVLSLSDCYQLAQQNSSLSKNPKLLTKLSDLRLQNIDAGRLPSVKWNAKATWQNEVFGLPFSFPGVDVSIPLYSIQTNLEGSYMIYDGGLSKAQKNVEEAKQSVEQQSITVELNKLKEQVNQVFFGALLMQEQAKLLKVTEADLEAKRQQLESGLRHGVVLESDMKKVQVEQLKVAALLGAVESDRKAMITVLESLTGKEIVEDTEMRVPDFDLLRPGGNQKRPEFTLFDLQKQALLATGGLLDASDKPKVSAFVHTGLGYPDPLNFFDDKISPYAILGLQFSWKFWDWKHSDRERQQLAIQSQLIDNQKSVFEENIGHQEGRFIENIAKIQTQIVQDAEIVKLQGEILSHLSSQLQHGVITTTDYLLQSNAELQARLNLETRRVQLAQLQTQYWTWKGWL